jgi:Copper resistance protein ScsC N-terminal domain
LLFGFHATAARSEEQTPSARSASSAPADTQAIIHDYIPAHPELLIESLQSAKRRQEEQQKEATQAFIRDQKRPCG